MGTEWAPLASPLHPHPHLSPSRPLSLTIRSGGNRAWVILAMFSRENWKEQLNMRKSWKMAGQSRGQMSCWPLKVEMVMESVQNAQGCMPVKPPSMYRCGGRVRNARLARGPLPTRGGHKDKPYTEAQGLSDGLKVTRVQAAPLGFQLLS